MRKAILITVGILLVLSIPALWLYGRPAYRQYKEKRALEQAKAYLAKEDYREASVSARMALVLNSTNLEAVQIMCQLAELARAPQALDWRRRIVEISPTAENKLLLATAALRSQPPSFPIAAETLKDLSNSPPFSVQFHLTCAEMCLKLNDFHGAKQNFEAAGRLDPTNELHRLNLSVLRLNSTNQTEAAAGRAELERLKVLTNLGPVALRWLVADSLKREDFAAATSLSRELLKTDAANWDDRLQYLTVLHGGLHSDYPAELKAVQTAGSTNSLQAYMTAAWMLKHGQVDEALSYLQHCPAKVKNQQPAPMGMVDCLMTKKDWSGLDAFLSEQKWGEIEFLRLAFWSRALAELKQAMASDARWRSAVREAGDRMGPLTALLEMAGKWGRTKDVEDLLWQINQRFPREKWTLRELDRIYMQSGNTRGLNKVYASIVKSESTNYVAKNNLAATSLLINPKDLGNAHQMAKEVYTEHPENASIASTYALSLYRQKRTKDALEVLEKLPPASLADPSVAFYYGIILAASGQTSKAESYVQKAKAATLLPEEKALLNEVRRK